MNDSPRPRRSPSVVLLDTMLSVVTAVQTGNLPGRRRAAARAQRAAAANSPGPGLAADGSARRTVPFWLLAGVLGTAGGVIVLVSTLLGTPGGLTDLPLPGRAAPAPPPATSIAPPSTAQQTAASQPASASPITPPVSASTAAPVSRSPSATTPSRSAPATADTRVLAAAYTAANGSGLLGYRATVTLDAEGSGPSTDWRLSITLPRPTLRIADVSGAQAEQDGAVWTFTPVEETRTVSPGTPVVIAFDVRGATLVDAQPIRCLVNDQPCTGLPD